MLSARILTYAFAASLSTTAAFAQDSASAVTSASSFARRLTFGVSFIQSRPQGELSRRVGLGYGANGSALLNLDARGIWSLRADIGGAQYGSVSRDITIGDASTDGLRFRLNASSYIMPVSIGAQVTLPTGMIQPYANAGIATQAFFTETSLQGDGVLSSASNITTTTNQSNAVAAFAFGGGMYVTLPVRTRKVQLDLGFQKLNGAHGSYLVPAATGDSTGARLMKVSSDTHLLVLRLGARIGW